MADMENTPPVGTKSTGGTEETQASSADITPSRRSSRKKQSTFSSDFEYYTPTGRKVETQEKPSPHLEQKVQQKKGDKKAQNNEDVELEDQEEEVEQCDDKSSKKQIQKKKVAQRKQKVIAEEEEEEDSDEIEKPKVVKGKPKIAAKKIQKSAGLTQKKKVVVKQKGKINESEESSDEEEEEKDTTKATPGKKRKLVGSGGKKKQTMLKKPKVGGKKKAAKDDGDEEGESSSDEEDSTPISQLQAQLKKTHESPLAQNLAKKLAEVDADSDDESNKSLAILAGQKRKLQKDGGAEPVSSKQVLKASQFEKLGSALASLVKRLPSDLVKRTPSDLVKRTPSEIAAKSGKEAVHNGLPATKQETAKQEATSSVKTVVKDAIMKPVSNQGAVKLDTKTTEEKSTKDLLKQALLSKPQKSKDVKVTQLKGVQGNKLQEPDELKVTQTKIIPQGKPDSNSATPQKPTPPPRRLTEEEIRQKKIAEIKAKIAEKSGSQKNMFVKKKKDLVETSGSQIKKDIKKEDLQHKKVKQGESHVKEQARKFSNVPPHLLKKRKALGKKLSSHSAHAENVLKKGIVHKRKSHQPFGNKNVVVKKFSDKKLSGDTEKPNDEKVKVDKPQDVNPDKGNKVVEERRKSVEKKRKSIDSVKDDKRKSAKREQRKSSEGSKKISDEKKRKSVGNEELQEKKMDDDGPPLLVHADSTPAKSKHKTHKVEHEVPLDMSMNDLFKPDVIPITQETEVSTPGGDAHDPSLVLSEEAQNVLLEHQYSKPSSPVAGVSGLSKKDSDIESVSHRAVMVDANLPDQILEDVTEDSNSRESETDVGVANDGNGDTKLPAGKNDDNPVERECIMKQLDSELKAGGSDFIIVGQVEISRLTPPSSAEKQSSPSDKDIASKWKKDNEIVDTESGSRKRKDSVSTDKEIAGKKRRDSETSGKELLSKKRRDSETGSEKRKSSTDSKEARLVKQKEKSHEKKGSKQKKDAEKGKNTSENDEDEESAEDEDFEDDENDIDWEDPDMLYCLCRKPHNNRFMICCDKCEEWYHGTCVGVTRARGKEMEDNEEEYVCPVCLKGESEPLIEKSHESSKSSEGSTPSSKLTQKCVGRKCNKVPRPGSVYCSNECIMNHAQESLKAIREEQAKKSSKEKHSSSQDSSSKSSSSKSPSADIVEVMERETGKILRGSQAPTQKGLHQWLEQHPSFEVVQPQQKHRSSSSRDSKDDRRKSSSDKDHRSLSSTSSSSSSNTKDRKYEKSDNRSHHRHHKDSSSRRESTSSSNSSSKDHSSKRIDRDRRHSSSSSSSSTPSHKADNSSSKKSDRGSDSVKDHNQIRSNVKTALRDSLSARARDAEDIQLSSSEIKALSATIEEELYSLFNDTGHKYRAKYRSLIFNIKDPKNKGLFRKILVGKIKPDQLVQMSTEDLASRELAKWREQESKHQLEMIQKLELAKQTEKTVAHVTKKTHKGEIEVDDEDMSTLETHLEEKISAEPEKAEDQSQEPVIDTTSQHRAHLFDLNCKVCTGKIVPGPEEQMATNTPTAKKKKKLGVQFALHENQEREIEPLEDIEENEENFENNVSEKEDIKYDQIKDEKKEEEEVKEADYVKAAEIVKEALEHVHKAEAEMSALPSMVSSSPKHGERTPSPPISPKEEPPYMDKFDDDDDDIKVSGSNTNVETGGTGGSGSYSDVGDKKLSALPKHAGTEGLLLSVPKSVSLPLSSVKVGAEKKVIVRSPDSPLQAGLEAKGKFTPTGPVLWKGFVSMLDVAKFFTSAYRVSGPTDHISIQDTIHIMGRISPDHMWDYLSKIRQSGSKDVTVLRFIPGSDEEKVAYIHLYSYLNSRSRCGVANNPSSKVKDFYIVPLASHSKIPRTLLPFDGPGLEENRPHMLIGILVRQRDKHSKDISSGSPHTSSSTKASKLSSSKVKAATGTTRDPRLAKLTSKTSSPKQSPSSSNSSGTAEVKQAEIGAKDEIEEYDPEYVPVLVKAKSSTEQPVAEYIPTVKAQDKVKGSSPKEVTSTDKSKKHHHHHHHHHHKEHHRHHKKDTAEDDSEPYSPGKEAEPYSPGQEAAAEEPYDPEDESLMDEEGHPIESAASTQAALPASATTSGSTTAKVESIVSVTPASTQASSDSQSKDSVQPSVQIDDLVEQMARSSDPAQISSLMVSALSKASTQQEQQQLLVRLTRQVEERKLQLATEASSSKDASDAQAVSSSGDTATQSAETDKSSEQVTPANVVSKPTDTVSNNKADILKDIGSSGKSSSGISFSIKSVDKPGSLTPSAVFSEKKTEEQKTELSGTLQKGPEQSGDEDKKPGDAQLPDALQALMNDVLGNTQISSLERRSKMLMKKDADRVAEQEKKLAAEKEEREKGDEDLEAEKIKMQQEAALEEARKRDEDEMEARKILESMKQPKSTHSEVKSLTPAESSSGASNELGQAEEKPTKAPTIDELLERLKKGGFQFPIQKANENPSSVGAGLGETSSVSATAETTSTTNTAPSIQGTSSSLSLSVSSSSSSSSSSISTMSSLPLTSNPCVPTYTGSKPVLPSSTLLSSSTSAVDLLSSSVDTDLRQQIPPSSKPLVASSSSAAGIHPASLLQDQDERQHHPSLHKEDRDDRPFRGSGAKHPLDPHAFPPLPSSFEDRRSLPPHPSFRGSSEYPPPYQPTPRSILPPPKARAQPPPPGTEFDRPAEVLGITDVDLRQPPLPPPLPPEPPPPLPPLPHQYHEDVDYRGADPFRGHHPHHPSHSYRGRPYSRH